jgi:hypothetical protein
MKRRQLFMAVVAVALAGLTVGLALLATSRPATANHIPYSAGDVFAAVGAGKIKHFTPGGVLLETLNTTSGSAEETGMCFDKAGNLHATNFTAGNMSKFDNQGGLLVHPWGGPFSDHPESCVVNAAGDVWVGEVDGANTLRKFNPAGTTLLESDSPDVESLGMDWIDLAADQCTMFYTSEGSSVKRYDTCTNTQLDDFATGLAAPCFALRIRANPPGEVIVTCTTQSYRLKSTDGSVLMTYPIAGESLFAMNLDPGGLHFWTAGVSTGNVYKVDIATGAGTGAPVFNAGSSRMLGLAIFREPTVSWPTPGPIGGVARDPAVGAAPLQSEPSSSSDAWLLTGGVSITMASVVVLGGGAWYVRRRRTR